MVCFKWRLTRLGKGQTRLKAITKIAIETIAATLSSINDRAMFLFSGRQRRQMLIRCLLACAIGLMSSSAWAAGEPAESFLKQLRAAGYFDVAITYLDRLDEYPGVDPAFTGSVTLEKAQTYIDAAVASRTADKRDLHFGLAEQQLKEFLKLTSHPRQSEARSKLGKLQLVRAAQLINQEKREPARVSYLAAAGTFDTILESLRETLKQMQGANIDAAKDPEKAALRDQYKGEFLEAMKNAGQARQLAAKTFKNPATEGKELLEKSLAVFTDLSEKYGIYPPGAMALTYRGQVQEALGKNAEAMDSYLRMLESPDADSLRDTKYQATSGLIRLWLAEKPPKYQQGIDRGQPLVDGERPNERTLESMQKLRIELAKSYLAKSKDKENQKPTDVKRAESSGRQLLLQASKVRSRYAQEASNLLSAIGIDLQPDAAQDAITEDPTSVEDAYEKIRTVMQTRNELADSLAVLKSVKEQTEALKTQQASIQKQLTQSLRRGVHLLRRGLALANTKSDTESTNGSRLTLAYLLYQREQYRDAAVVGTFLAKHAAGTDVGLQGGLTALNALQLLLRANDDPGLIEQLGSLSLFLTETWPDDPKAAAAKGVMIKLMLGNGDFEKAGEMVKKMPAGSERAYYQRLMGEVLWNQYVVAKRQGNGPLAVEKLSLAIESLQAGLSGIPADLADPDAMKTALTLTRAHLKQGDPTKALAVLEDKKYGPIPLLEKQGAPSESFTSDLYSTELQVIVQLMTTPGGDSNALLKRAIKVMEKLRTSFQGPDAQKKLNAIYIQMARDIREQLDVAVPDRKAKLIAAFRVFLERISSTTQDQATLRWIGKTLMDLAEASMQPGQNKANGQAAELLATAATTFATLKDQGGAALEVDFQLGRTKRLLGEYKAAIDLFHGILKTKPAMLDVQIEAAQSYESWAAIVPPKFAGKAYASALNGARPGANRQNVVWGWGKISVMASKSKAHQTKFFDARYHVALCRLKWGRATKDQRILGKAITDITKVNALYPAMGGPEQRAKFNQLLKTIQKQSGKSPTGLPPLANSTDTETSIQR